MGDLLQVDGLLVNGSEVVVDESSLTGESDPIKKSLYVSSSNKEGRSFSKNSHNNYLMISGTKVVDG
jgi:magnesium-transporting ATPase (P-type)